MYVEVHHYPLSVACQLPAAQIVANFSDERRWAVVVMVDDKTPGCAVDVHLSHKWPSHKLVDHRIATPRTVAIAQFDDCLHPVSFVDAHIILPIGSRLGLEAKGRRCRPV